MSRRFLKRTEATYALGLACASQMPRASWIPDGADARVACRAADGTIHEAEPGETLHVQIMARIGDYEAEAGWTCNAEWWAASTGALG